MSTNNSYVYKYTIVLPNEDKPTTYYVEAYDPEIGKEELALKLNVNPEAIRWNGKNIPYIVRQMINDKTNKEYTIFLKTTRTKSNSNTFSLKDSILSKIKKLYKYDEKLLSSYKSYKDAFDDLEKQIIINNLQDLLINDVTLLDILYGYLTNQSEELKKQFGEKSNR